MKTKRIHIDAEVYARLVGNISQALGLPQKLIEQCADSFLGQLLTNLAEDEEAIRGLLSDRGSSKQNRLAIKAVPNK